MTIRRQYGRIWFGDGHERWSVNDPDAPENQYTQRGLASDWQYMIATCPDTRTAIEKVRLIRRALRTVDREPMKSETEQP